MKRDFGDPTYKRWRKSVYSRDKFKCQWPGCESRKKLNAHHIMKWADNPGLRYNADNGITLCYLHHLEIGSLTMEQSKVSENRGIL